MDQKDAIAQLLLSGQVPVPRPDPRGSTFNTRLPRAPVEEMKPFGAGEIPAAALLYSRGIAANPDRMIYSPYDIMNSYFAPDWRQENI